MTHPTRTVLVFAVGALILKVFLGVAASLLFGFSLQSIAMGSSPEATPEDPGSDMAYLARPPQRDPSLDSLRTIVSALESALAATRPGRAYIVIDRGNNRLWLRRGSDQLLEAMVSTGSGTILRESRGSGRTWTFDTPSGHLRIQSERANPVWTKPDWAFLEEGRDPPATLAERRERGSLGEWALDLGDGYMIHGTLYERLLGRSLTHGCIRVGRDDLRTLVRTAGPGTHVYIY